jgi:hypothetical protein
MSPRGRALDGRSTEANMLKNAQRVALMVMLCAIVGGAHAARPPTTPGTSNLSIVAVVAGDLTFAVNGEAVRLTARGDGRAARLCGLSAEATWAPAIDNVLALLAGQIEELSIATGTFAVEFADGDTVHGMLSGTIRPRDDGTFGLVAKFVATGGTGAFAGVTGGGTLHAVDDLTTLEFRAILHAKLAVPK